MIIRSLKCRHGHSILGYPGQIVVIFHLCQALEGGGQGEVGGGWWGGDVTARSQDPFGPYDSQVNKHCLTLNCN